MKRNRAKPANYFYDKASGLNADIKRHTEKEIALSKRIEELEAIPEDKKDNFDVTALKVYREFLLKLKASKANVVSKLGRK